MTAPILSQSLFALLQVTLSADRLAPYRRPLDQDDLDAAARYLWNVALCEALYPVLQAQEIALRNTLHNAISSLQGAMWFDAPGLLDPHAQTVAASPSPSRRLPSRWSPLSHSRQPIGQNELNSQAAHSCLPS
jgi:hypothetical protein